MVPVTDRPTIGRISRAVAASASSGGGPGGLDEASKASVVGSARALESAACVVLVFHRGELPVSPYGKEPRTIGEVHPADLLSIGACMENMALAAQSLGIASLWMCDVLEAADDIGTIAGVANPLVAAMALGFPCAAGARPPG